MGTRVRPSRDILRGGIKFSLFATSYAPLFLLVIIKQVSENAAYLHWGGFGWNAFAVFLKNFGVAAALGITSVLGFIGLAISIKNLQRRTASSGVPVTVRDAENRNSEAISYISTYIIPILFQNYSDWFEVTAIAVLLVVIYFIYVNSTLLLINPVLNLRYSLYQVEFADESTDKSTGMPLLKRGILITSSKELEQGDRMLLKKIGHKLFFGVAA